MLLIDPEVTRLKVERELDLWRDHANTYRRRGWVLLAQRDTSVDIGFLGQLTLGCHVNGVVGPEGAGARQLGHLRRDAARLDPTCVRGRGNGEPSAHRGFGQPRSTGPSAHASWWTCPLITASTTTLVSRTARAGSS